MMTTTFLGRSTASTILGGVVDLIHHGAYGIAFVVFAASVVIPVSKFFIIGFLALSIQFRLPVPVHTRIHLYEAVEFIGRWSMVDVFVVAILTALIQMGFFAAIEPGRRRYSSRFPSPLPCFPHRLWTPD
jgi:paraquat-inducible protein A